MGKVSKYLKVKLMRLVEISERLSESTSSFILRFYIPGFRQNSGCDI